ncbi:hypothetical protein HS7_14140 [Sulfolobales archaeon HS-7]|nr:hypothetical protein HS7_14140 [Sulfolobales archaeon HS-7]
MTKFKLFKARNFNDHHVDIGKVLDSGVPIAMSEGVYIVPLHEY